MHLCEAVVLGVFSIPCKSDIGIQVFIFLRLQSTIGRIAFSGLWWEEARPSSHNTHTHNILVAHKYINSGKHTFFATASNAHNFAAHHFESAEDNEGKNLNEQLGENKQLPYIQWVVCLISINIIKIISNTYQKMKSLNIVEEIPFDD